MIKFWNPVAQYEAHEEEIDSAIKRVLKSGQLVLGYGADVEELETNFARFLGKKYAIMVGAGTQALYLTYKAILKPGDRVAVPSNTFIATIDQLVAIGAKPVIIDCGQDGLIGRFDNDVDATVVVHMEGKVARNPGGLVIEDAAQAVGASGVGFGIAQCYSLFPAKIFGSAGNAGMITTDDETLAKRLRLLRCNSNIGKNPDLDAELGTNMEPDVIQAAILNVKLKYLPQVLARRKEVAQRYLSELKAPIELPCNQEGRVWQDFMIHTSKRDELKEFLELNGVQSLIPNPRIPNHHYTAIKCDLPNTDRYVATKLALPCNDTITDEEVSRVIELVNKFYE